MLLRKTVSIKLINFSTDKEKLYFFQPEELLSHLEDEAAKLENGEEKPKAIARKRLK